MKSFLTLPEAERPTPPQPTDARADRHYGRCYRRPCDRIAQPMTCHWIATTLIAFPEASLASNELHARRLRWQRPSAREDACGRDGQRPTMHSPAHKSLEIQTPSDEAHAPPPCVPPGLWCLRWTAQYALPSPLTCRHGLTATDCPSLSVDWLCPVDRPS